MYQSIPFTKNRQVIFDLLTRAKKFHMPISSCLEIDCTDAMDQLRSLRRQGGSGSFSAFLAKASATLLEEQPHLNTHLFTKWNGRKEIAKFDDISCNLIVQRIGQNGESILLPLVIKNTNKLSIEAIDAIIHHHKTAPLEELEQFQSFEKIKRTPNFLLRFFSYKVRSDPKFYLKFFGTYGLSTLYSFKASSYIAGSTVANTAIAFLPYTVVSKDIGNEKRRIMKMGIVMDHYILDGAEMTEACYGFQKLIENPGKILAINHSEL